MALVKVVLDTNVVVSAHLASQGYPRFVLDLGLAGKVRIYLSPSILTEYEAVLRRPRFAIDPKLITASLRSLKRRAKLVHPTQTVTASPDPDDNRFLECAEKASADYLVTGNKRHFPTRWQGTRVVSPREFIEFITPELKR
jgi:putative PIN family toxin of toxin-antitoxin system